MSTGAILLAAGFGRRFGHRQPKQFLRLRHQPLFLWSLRVFAQTPSISEIVLVVPRSYKSRVAKMLRRWKFRPPVNVVTGGPHRGASVKCGLLGFHKIPDIVLVHDTARPLVDFATIRRVQTAVRRHGVALAAWPLPDTLKKSRPHDMVRQTVPRTNLWLAQTPQGFRRGIALRCLMTPSSQATDDVELAQRQGFKAKLVLGSAANFKITVPADLEMAERLAK